MCHCQGNHRIASVVGNGLGIIEDIVRDHDGKLAVDLEMIGRDLKAAVLARDLRYFTVQAYDSSIRAMWALMIRGNRYALLAPESTPAPAVLREAQWRVVMYRRHVAHPLDREVLTCARLTDVGDPARRWQPAATLAGPGRRSGVVVHTPYRNRTGVVHSSSGNTCEHAELELTRRDARSHAHCRRDHDHLLGQAESACADLRPGDPITYIPMLRLPSQIPVAFLASREQPSPRPHLSGIGLSPIRPSV